MNGYFIEFDAPYSPRKEHIHFNREMATIVDDIFQTESPGPDGYIPVGKYSLDDIGIFIRTQTLFSCAKHWMTIQIRKRM
jgi:hypothetical protein